MNNYTIIYVSEDFTPDTATHILIAEHGSNKALECIEIIPKHGRSRREEYRTQEQILRLKYGLDSGTLYTASEVTDLLWKYKEDNAGNYEADFISVDEWFNKNKKQK